MEPSFEEARARSLDDSSSRGSHQVGEAHPRAPASPRARSDLRRLVDVLDWFIPDPLATSPRRRLFRARLTVAIGFLCSLAVLATLVAAPEVPDSAAVRIASFSLVAMLVASPFFLKSGVPDRLVQNGMIAMMFGYGLVLAGVTGGADSGGVIVAILTPLFAIMLCGTRAGLVWSMMTCFSLAAIAVAVGAGFDAPVKSDQSEVASWSLWAGIAGILATAGVAFMYEWLQASMVSDLSQAKTVAEFESANRLASEASFRRSLERLVADRTDELVRSREQLRRADRLASIGTLAAGVAHQINNPIGSILIGAEFALLDPDPLNRVMDYRKALESVVLDAKRCRKIVRSLLRFSGNGTNERVTLDLNEAAHRAIATLREFEGQMDLNLSSSPLWVEANPIEMEQIILNLISNALQAESEIVEVHTRRVGSQAEIMVRDRGRGISEEDQARIFDPFFTTRLNEGGTGLGLSIVHSLVVEHGGTVEVESEPGSGTSFSIAVPISPAASDFPE